MVYIRSAVDVAWRISGQRLVCFRPFLLSVV